MSPRRMENAMCNVGDTILVTSTDPGVHFVCTIVEVTYDKRLDETFVVTNWGDCFIASKVNLVIV